MGASLGVRISAVLVAGSLAVVAASCAADGAGSSGGGSTIVEGGLSGGGQIGGSDGSGSSRDTGGSGGSGGAAPTWQLPNGNTTTGSAGSTGSGGSGGAGGSGDSGNPGVSEGSGGSGGAKGSKGSGGSSGPDGGDNGGGGGIDGPAWLPPGPRSPNTENAPDPSSVYDRLRRPAQCQDALGTISQAPLTDDWRVLRGLANGCLAIQGRGGSWDTAAEDYAALKNRVDTCKGSAAYEVLGGLLEFHRQHPDDTVQLESSPGGNAACDFVIGTVDVGGDGEARPGDTISIELLGTYFDHSELLRDGSVTIGRQRLPGPPTLLSESGDRLVLSAVVPDPGTPSPETVDVIVRCDAAEATKEKAFTILVVDRSGATGTPSAVQ